MNQLKNNNKNTFINLIISGLLNKKIDNLEVKNPAKFMALAEFHSLETIMYKAFIINNIPINDDIKKIYQMSYMKMITQDVELDELLKAFTEAKLYHLPLKGSILRTYYDEPIKRIMADLDILFHEEDLPKAGEIVQSLGYEVEDLGGNHDVYHKKPYMNIELHRALISDVYDTHSYFLDIWDRVNKDDYTCKMTDEDFLIFNILHAGKHFINGGAGLRFFCDLYFFFKHCPNVNMEHVYSELKKTGYDTYGRLIISISDKLFKGIDLNDDELYILEYMITAGTYGTFDNSAATGVAKEEREGKKNSKISFFFKRIFPPYKDMVRMYPGLKGKGILLPIYYIRRIFRVIFKSKTYKAQLKSLNEVSSDDIEKIRKIEEITGIRG